MPARMNASSIARDCAFVRYRTATTCSRSSDSARLAERMMKSASSSSSPPAEVQDLRAALAIRPEPLLLAVAVLADHGGRRIEDHLRRAVVPLQPHDVRVGEVVLEIEDVLQVGAAPLVDRLVGVADDAEIAMAFGQAAHQHVLRPVRVLVLVHHHEPELLAVPGRGCDADLSNSCTVFSSRSSKSRALQFSSAGHVVAVDAADLLVTRVPAVREALGPGHRVLRLADPRQRRPRLHERVVDLAGRASACFTTDSWSDES